MNWRKHLTKKQKHYFTLVSEIMLQQTQVKTVIPYFNNFIKKIPNLKKLAKINDRKLLKCWEGLGYYSRARNLKKTAKKIIKEFNGNLPDNIDQLKSLPGIGDYTSTAIMAIVFNKKLIPLDGNVERILKRIFYLKTEKEISKNNLHRKKSFFGKSNRSSDYAQAIMEIGALICKPFNPICTKCPVNKFCYASKRDRPEAYPIKNKIKPRPHFNVVIAIIWRQNKFFIQKRKTEKMLGGLWEFPGGIVSQGEDPKSILKDRQEELVTKATYLGFA